MTNPTTPFSWQMPTSTDLVTDLPADFAVFGQAVATSMADLLGGTTGQILSKATNTDMDFTWITNDVGDITAVTAGTGISGGGTSGAVTVTNSMATTMTTKGDLVPATGSGTFARLAVGTNGQTIVADSTASTGLKYSSNAPLGGMTLLNAGGTALTGATTITVSGISNKSRLTIIVNTASANASSQFSIRFNTDATGNYGYAGLISNAGTLASAYSLSGTSIPFALQGNNAANEVSGILNLEGAFSAGMTQYNLGSKATGTGIECYNFSGFYVSAAQIDSVSILSSSGNFDAGTIYVYGV